MVYPGYSMAATIHYHRTMPSTTKNTRAGRYIRQPAGFRAFIPAPLPPSPPVRIDGKLQKALSQADLAIGRLDGSVHTLPHPDLFVKMYVRKESVHSSQIEGTQSSLHDLLASEAKIFAAPDKRRDVAEVANHVAAMNLGLQQLKKLPVSVRLIRNIHKRLMQGVRGGGAALQPGELRASQNWIGPAGGALADAVFIPPPAHEVPGALGDLEKFIHANDDSPPLIKAGLAHAQFEAIHPFLDGNGRTGRLLITLMLVQQGIINKPVLYLSHYFNRRRDEYYRRLQAAHNGDWEGWLLFFLRGVAEVADGAAQTAADILSRREKHLADIIKNFGRVAANDYKLLEHLYARPIVTVAEARELTGVTYAAANNLIARMVGIGVLKNITPHARNRRFRFDPYVRLFDDSAD